LYLPISYIYYNIITKSFFNIFCFIHKIIYYKNLYLMMMSLIVDFTMIIVVLKSILYIIKEKRK